MQHNNIYIPTSVTSMMKKVVWENKSNKQLCATIPKNSGIKAGDVVNIEKEKINKIVYSSIVGNPFHYGHLHFLQAANELGDLHICGVLTDSALKEYRGENKHNFKERSAMVISNRCVDMVMPQNNINPGENLKKIHEQFPRAKIILVHGDNWKKIIGEEEVKKLKGEAIKLLYYKKLSE